VLYQLSYTHHGAPRQVFLAAAGTSIQATPTLPGLAQPSVPGGGASSNRAAMAFAASPSGPGCGTKTASR
jgi:hypothetical protein